ncbi:MAG: DUF2924 domain-containing protein, partial [Rhodobacterales bacterium]|nr:DUF2924 domain-containing protein [Rhodobacterales bacterium]
MTKPNRPLRTSTGRSDPPDGGPRFIPARLAALKSMSVTELKAEWQTLFDTTAPNNSRAFLESRLAYRIQELTHGGPDRETRR